MEPAYNIYEQIDRYLRKELSGEELVDFNSRMTSDEELKKLVEVQRIVNKTIIDGEMINLKKRMIKDFSEAGNSSINWLKIIGIASVVIIAATYGYIKISKPSESNKLVEQKKDTQIQPVSKEQSMVDKVNSSPAIVSNDIPSKKTTVNPSEDPKLQQEPLYTDPLPLEVAEEKSPVSNNASKGIAVGDPTHETPTIKNEKAKITCESVKIVAEANVYFSTGDEEATVIIDKLSIKGGTAPYTYAIDDNTFSFNNTFHHVEEGSYRIRIKDHNNCVSDLPNEVVVKMPVKQIDDVFAPGLGERWKFPLKENVNATITIISKTGNTVYSASIKNGIPGEWDGRDNSGNDLESGNYYFIINFTNNEMLKGHISIVK